MRAVVTGGAGFLGSHLCRRLLAEGWGVVCLDSLKTGTPENISDLLSDPSFRFEQYDVTNYVRVDGPVDWVFHLASLASPPDYLAHPIHTLKVGALGTLRAAGLAKAKGAGLFFASTSEIYGDPEVHPQPESYRGNVDPVGPRGVYDESKRFGEAMVTAYHQVHGIPARIARIFNSIQADEQVLYDDGKELRRESAEDAAARLGRNRDLVGVSVPAFDRSQRINPSRAMALIGHPTQQRCYEVRTRYGRSVRVTGDHSLFIQGKDGTPTARRVSDLHVGDRIAIARRIEVPERDRRFIDVVEALVSQGMREGELVLSWPGLGTTVWERRAELFSHIASKRRPASRVWRSVIWGEIAGRRGRDRLPLDLVRALGISIPPEATVSLNSPGRSAALPVVVHVSDEFLWLLGLWIAEGSWYEGTSKSAFVSLSADEELLDRAAKIIDRELGLHVVRATGGPKRSASAFVHSRLLLRLLEHLGFGPGPRRIPGWVLGLTVDRLGWFLEGYREGDGVHSGKKFIEGVRHEFSTTSEALKDDLVVALARYGLVPSVGRYETRFRKKTGDRRYPFWRLTLPKVSPWSPLEWCSGVHQVLQSPTQGDIVWAVVRSVQEVPGTDLVYDWSVPGKENFWAGSGVMAHNTYGPAMRPDDGRAVPTFISQALANEPITVHGDGSQTRSLCFVDDLIEGFWRLLNADLTQPVNLGNPEEVTVLELAERIRDACGSDSEISFTDRTAGDPERRRPDISLARERLGWEPTVALSDGLARTVKWAREAWASA